MNTQPLVSVLEASNRQGIDYYTDYPLRKWALVERIRQMTRDNVCGELCSLRLTWQRPKKLASDEQSFLYQKLPWLLDAAWFLADAPLTTLHIERVPREQNLFALAMFENGVAAEIEMNESLPDSMPATSFIKANFTHGHLTNQPVVGHFNEEGAILADDTSCERLLIENRDWDDCGDEMAICHRSLLHAIEKGKHPQGPLNSTAIIMAIKQALEERQ